MQLIRSLDGWPDTRACAATIGNFDGVHLGHQAMFAQLIAAAKNTGLPTCVISFEPLPHEFFAADSAPARLQGLRDRAASIAECGVDRLLLLPFDADFSSQSATDFIRQTLVETLAVKHLIVGDDFRFGRQRQGDFALLSAAAKQFGFRISSNATVSDAGERISSSRIRNYLHSGELAAAARLLGRPYRISGRVVHGEKMGRQLGFPTANVSLKGYRPPLRGVFAVLARNQQSGQSHAAVANLGARPTLGGHKLLLEVHVLDDELDLYGQHLQVDFLKYLRSEQRFDSLDALKQQIGRDAEAARRALDGNPAVTDTAKRIQ